MTTTQEFMTALANALTGLVALAAAGAYGRRHRLIKEADAITVAPQELTVHEAAMLFGGRDRVVDTAITRLFTHCALAVDGQGRVVRGAESAAHAGRVEQVVYHRVCTDQPVAVAALRSGARDSSAVREVMDRLERHGLAVDATERDRAALPVHVAVVAATLVARLG